MSDDRIGMTLDEGHALAVRVLEANGCDRANADAVARTMLLAERDGSESHGLYRLPGYVAALRSGKVDGSAAPRIERIAPAVVRVDAAGGFAPLALRAGHDPLVAVAREAGVAVLAVRDVYHFAALWPETEALAEAGLVALACTAAAPMVAPHGGTKPFFGTNPIAFAFPRTERPPVVFDMATAAMARGDVAIHARDGRSVPAGTGIDAEGRPTTDPEAILAGAQLPFGGYKGSLLAMMVELLAAAAIGDRFSVEARDGEPNDGGPPRGGEFVLAMDPALLGGGSDWAARSDRFYDALEAAGGRLPGARRLTARSRTAAEGFALPRALHEHILALAARNDTEA